MDERERRWERMERLMEFILESDARISARLDRIGKRLDSGSKPVDSVSSFVRVPSAPMLSAQAEAQHAQILRIADSVDILRVDMRLAIKRLLEIADEIREAARTLSASTVDQEREVLRLEDRMPPDAV